MSKRVAPVPGELRPIPAFLTQARENLTGNATRATSYPDKAATCSNWDWDCFYSN